MAAQLGIPFMPWQQLVADVGAEIDSRGKPFYREVVVTVPRQNAKTSLVFAFGVQRALGWKKIQRVAYTAQTGWDARKKLIDDLAPLLVRSPLGQTVKQVLRGAGMEGVMFANGSRIDVIASSAESGHGRTVDLGVIDEAFADVDARREQALLPAMATRSTAQLLVVSTAGTDASPYLRRKVEMGRTAAAAGKTSGIAYFEWSAPDDADIDDPATWRACMPALDHTITEEVVAHARQTMTEGEFRRAFLNQWTASEERIIGIITWETVQTSSKRADRDYYFAVDVTPERSAGSIASAGTSESGDMVVEIVDHQAGVGWLVERAVELARKWYAPVVVDGSGPASNFIPELQAAGIQVVVLTGRDKFAAACSGFYDDVADHKVWVRRHESLDRAVAGASKRSVGDAWAWARKDAAVDVSPLVAATLALTGARSNLGMSSAGFTSFDDDE